LISGNVSSVRACSRSSFSCFVFFVFFFTDTSSTEIYTLSLHDALPILLALLGGPAAGALPGPRIPSRIDQETEQDGGSENRALRSEEHTSELQSRFDLVCRLLLEKKKSNRMPIVVTVHYFDVFREPRAF